MCLFIYCFLKKGDKVAKYCGEHAHERIIDDPAFTQGKYYEALKNGFLGLDEDLLKGFFFFFEWKKAFKIFNSILDSNKR